LGAGLGYGHRVSNHFALRADFTTVGAFKHSGTIDLLQYRQLNYRARFKVHQLGIYGDWFPFENGLRLSAGLHVRQLQADLKLHPSVINVRIGKKTLPYHPKAGDNITGRVKFPALAPYLGIGWESGLGESGGVAFGEPRVDLTVSQSLRNKLKILGLVPGNSTEVEIDAERQKLLKRARKVRFFPHLYAGLAYRF